MGQPVFRGQEDEEEPAKETEERPTKEEESQESVVFLEAK